MDEQKDFFDRCTECGAPTDGNELCEECFYLPEPEYWRAEADIARVEEEQARRIREAHERLHEPE